MADSATARPDEPSLFDYAALLVRNRQTLLIVPLAAALLTALISFLLPTTWAANATFVQATTQGTPINTGLGALAGQLGITLAAGSGDSPQFYAELVKSRELRDAILSTRFARSGAGGDSAALLEILDIKGPTESARLETGRKRLGKLLATTVDRQTGIVKVSAAARDPELAAAIANRVVVLIDEFNLKKRNTQARERRRFVEERLATAEEELRIAEDGLRRFLNANRQYDAPQLQFEYGRLQRQVQVTQEVYLTLRREYETARIQEVNDTPALSVIDSATAPYARATPDRARLVLLALLAGLVLTLCWLLSARALIGLRYEQGPAYARLLQAWRSGRLTSPRSGD